VRLTSEIKASIAAAGLPAGVGEEFDGYGSFLVPSLEGFLKAFEDPFYIERIKPDEDTFMDRESTFMFVAGYEAVFI
jgi:hypothetical protein